MVTRVDHVREALLRLPIQFRRNGIIGTETASAVAVEGPTASFTANADGLEVDFTDTSTEGDAAITGWSWDFDGEDTSTEQNPTHTFASAGTKTVTLEVTDANGNTSSTQMEVEVDEPAATDGDGIYVPETEGQFASLSVPAPTNLLLCQDDGTGDTVADEFGSLNLSEIDANDISYQASVPGWSRHFLATSESGQSRGWTSDSIEVADGESMVVLLYVAYGLDGATRAIAEINGTTDRIIALDDSTIRTRHGNTNTDGSEDHEDLATVRPYLWVRNAADDFSGLFTDLEPITGTHHEGLINDVFALGALNTRGTADARYGYVAIWRGTDADALISAGLANQTLLTTFGFTLGAGYA